MVTNSQHALDHYPQAFDAALKTTQNPIRQNNNMSVNARRRKFKFSTRLGSRLLVILLLLTAARFTNWPRQLLADDDHNDLALQGVFSQSRQAMRNQQWHLAERYLLQASARLDRQDARFSQITDDLDFCRANTLIEKRYRDGSVTQQARSIDFDLATKQLSQILTLINESYYQPIDWKLTLKNALLQMRAGLTNQVFLEQFARNKADVQPLAERIMLLREQISTMPPLDDQDIVSLARSWTPMCGKIGLPLAWPMVELAYGLAAALDEYSYLLSPRQYDILCDRLRGTYVGVGIDLVIQGDFPTVFDVVPGSSAKNAGICPGDTLISVDGNSLKTQSAGAVSQLLSGLPNSRLELLFSRNGQDHIASLKRCLVVAPTIRQQRLLGIDHSIGYMRIAGFDHDTAMEMRRAIDALLAQGARSLLIDLRSNGGGVMTSAIDAVRLFIDHGLIVTVATADKKTRYEAGGNAFDCFDMPLAILVDQNTASAAEIFTAALQVPGRAVVIGNKTFGKGVAQTILPIAKAQSALCLTSCAFVGPDDKGFHGCGITPDYLIDGEKNQTSKAISVALFLSNNDPALQKAIRWLASSSQFVDARGVSTLQKQIY